MQSFLRSRNALCQNSYLSVVLVSPQRKVKFPLSKSFRCKKITTNTFNILFYLKNNSFDTMVCFTQLVRSLSSSHKVPGSIPGSAKVSIFVWASFSLKFSHLSILARSVNRVLADTQKFKRTIMTWKLS